MRTKDSLHRVGDMALKISIGAAMLGLGIWLFAPDSWFSGKTAAAIALFVMPFGFIVYGLTRLLAYFAGGSDPNSN
jgi:uncharacterized membrane protein